MLFVLLLLAVVLLALGPAAPALPPAIARRAGAAACLAALAVDVAALLTGAQPGGVAGLPLQWDGLSAWMALPVLIAALPAALTGSGRTAAAGGMLLLLMTGDAPLLALALAGVGAGLRGRTVSLPVWAGCSAAAALLLGLHAEPGFAAMRAAPPDGVLAAVALLLAMAGLAALWRGALRGEGGASPVALAALGLYVLARIALDLCGPATPVWWGVALTSFGLAAAVLGGVRASAASGLGAVIGAGTVAAGGLACAGLGVALAARGADLPAAAALGVQAALLLALSQAAALVLLGLCTGGGRTATALAAAVSLASLPPSAGFAGLYLLLQALFTANRIDGVLLQFGCACAVAVAGLAAALGALAALRTLGLGLLAGPADPSPDLAIARAGLAGLGVVLGVAPGAALLLARPALLGLVSAGPVDVTFSGPAVVAALLAAAFAGLWWATRGAPAPRRAAAWEGGAAAPPRLAPYVPALLTPARIAWPTPRPPTLREWLAGATAALAITLIVLAAR